MDSTSLPALESMPTFHGIDVTVTLFKDYIIDGKRLELLRRISRSLSSCSPTHLLLKLPDPKPICSL